MSKCLWRSLIWTIVAGALAAQTLIAQNATRIDDVAVDAIVKKAGGNQGFMGAVLAAKDGAIVFNRAYGLANLEWQIPNTVDTRFRIGSVSKQFTAAAILLLEDRGKLNTGDIVKKHLPEAPAAWDAVTIHHLLSHTSGVPSLTSMPEFPSLKTLPARPDKSLARYIDKPLEFAPGTKWNYSNSGYLLLALIVERVSGQPFETFLEESVLRPLGMSQTGSDSFTAIIPKRASGYTPMPGPQGVRLRNADYIDMTIPIGGGSLYSTTEDLVRWSQGLFGGKLLSAASLRKMTQPVMNNYAYGVGVNTVDGRQLVSHDGGIEGFNSTLHYYPASKVTVTVLANVNGPAPGVIAQLLGRLAHD